MGTTWVPIYSHMGPHLLPRGSPIAPHGPPIANLGPIDAAHMVGGVCSGPLMICKAVDLSRKNKGVQGGPCGTKTSYIVCKDLAHCKHQDLWTHPSLCAWTEWKCVCINTIEIFKKLKLKESKSFQVEVQKIFCLLQVDTQPTGFPLLLGAILEPFWTFEYPLLLLRSPFPWTSFGASIHVGSSSKMTNLAVLNLS